MKIEQNELLSLDQHFKDEIYLLIYQMKQKYKLSIEETFDRINNGMYLASIEGAKEMADYWRKKEND